MHTLTIIMAAEPQDAQDFAFEEHFAPVLWPEIANGIPVANGALLGRVDRWIAKLAEGSIEVVTHSALVPARTRRRVAEGALAPEALRIVHLPGDGAVSEVKTNKYGAGHDWPDGWCDADTGEAEAAMRAAVKQRAADRGTR